MGPGGHAEVAVPCSAGRKERVIGLSLRYGETAPMPGQKAGAAQQRLRRGLEAVGCGPRREQGGLDKEGDGSVEDVEIACHGDGSNA